MSHFYSVFHEAEHDNSTAENTDVEKILSVCPCIYLGGRT